MRKKLNQLAVCLFLVLAGTVFTANDANGYTFTMTMEDVYGGAINIEYTLNMGASGFSMDANCCFSSYHPALEGAVIDGCLNMTLESNMEVTWFVITINGGPLTYTFGGWACQVYYDNVTMDFNSYTYDFYVSGTIYVDGTPYDLSGWGSEAMGLLF